MVLIVIAMALLGAACQGSAGTTTTTTEPSPVDLPEPTDSTTSSTSSTTTEPAQELSAPQYQIVRRIPGDDAGDELVVLLDPTSYDSLSDIDIQDLLAEVVELFPPVDTAHLIDDASATAVVIDPEATEADIDAVAIHYLARLDNGFEITYLGPFAESGTGVLGS